MKREQLLAKMAPPPPVRPKSHAKTAPSTRVDPATNIRLTGLNTSTDAAAALVDPNKPLTDKQLAFVRAWASGESITSASARAGYNDDSKFAYRMVRMPNVLKVYKAEKQKYEASCQMTRKRVMDGLLEAAEMAKLMAEPSSMVSAWREIGKMCGYYEPVKVRVDVSVAHDVTVRQLNSMSDAELLKLVKGGGHLVAADVPMLTDESEEVTEEAQEARE